MKRYLSVFMLLVRSSLYKVLAVLAAMAGVQTGLFVWAARRQADYLDGFLLEAAFVHSGALIIFGAAAAVITLLLCAVGCDGAARSGYTLRRLQVSEKTVMLLQWGSNCVLYLLLWGAQLAVALGLCRVWAEMWPGLVNQQTVFLAFWRSEFLHPLLPLQDTGLWLRNAVAVVTLGAAAAVYPYRQRRGKKLPAVQVFVLGCVAAYWPAALGRLAGQIALSVVCMFVLMTLGACLWEEDELDA